MVLGSSLYGGAANIPLGDKLRSATFALTGSTTADITILNVASGGGVVHFIGYQNNSAGNVQFNSLKVTIDGASERTISLGDFATNIVASGTENFTLNVPINFDDSCIVKINYTTSGSLSGDGGVILYSVK